VDLIIARRIVVDWPREDIRIAVIHSPGQGVIVAVSLARYALVDLRRL